ncbi:MAG: phosphatidylserine decarboxylase family protein [Rikenellaceae bacterium]|nr:phosphatidylserine decarboxylase family protein [Rikenellaceae bacterium]
MKIHKEGRNIIFTTLIIFALLWVLLLVFANPLTAYIISGTLFLIFLFVLRFFRVPSRHLSIDNRTVYAPADGTVVAVEKVFEGEYLDEERIQVSVFMSIWNIHVNWFPVGGVIEYFKHHHGEYLVAWHPKSSEKNERTTTVVNTGNEKILFRQIAGYVARRIVSYAAVGEMVAQNSQCGFIKFGSRVDILLPLNAEICVSVDQEVVGTQTKIARLKD